MIISPLLVRPTNLMMVVVNELIIHDVELFSLIYTERWFYVLKIHILRSDDI